jgi:hypothetical protein
MRMRDDGDHKAGQEAGAAWRRIKSAGRRSWAEWTTKIGPFLVKARTEAIHTSRSNGPSGRGYNTAMSGLLVAYHLDDMEKVTRADMLHIMEELVSVEHWHAKQPGRERLNHPTTVWRLYKSSGEHKAVEIEEGTYKSPKERAKIGPTAAEEAAHLRDLLQQAEARIEELEQELSAARERLAELEARLAADDPGDIPAFLKRDS